MAVNFHLLAQQTALEARWHALKRELVAAALMHLCVPYRYGMGINKW